MNLTDHLMLRPVYKVKNLASLNDIYYSMTKKFMTGLKYLLFRKGPLTVGASYLCGFVKSDPHLATPNLQFHVSPASTDVLGKGSLHKFTGFELISVWKIIIKTDTYRRRIQASTTSRIYPTEFIRL